MKIIAKMRVATLRQLFSDYELQKKLYVATKGREFNADDFRELGLLRELEDPKHQTRGFFSRMVQMGFVKAVGRVKSRTPSNMDRKITLYVWTEKAEKVLGDN